jgi:2-polyprenyl-3-methyl-5-hydroxy-6-metoxy-1,4-benzoquinol methylase
MSKYAIWKKWQSEDFGLTSIEESLYFNKIFNIFARKTKSILEIGYGNGSFLGWCQNKKYNITGIEQDNELIKRAKKNRFTVFKSIKELSQKNKFDLIVLFDVIEHIPQNNIKDYLESIKKLLNQKGKIFIRCPNGGSPFGLENQHGDLTHFTAITQTKIEYWSKILEFKILYLGKDLQPLYRGKILRVPSALIKRILYKISKKIIKFIFSYPYELSDNLFCVLEKTD